MTQSWLFICISKQPKLLGRLKTGSSWKEKTHQWAVSHVPVPSTIVTCWWGASHWGPQTPQLCADPKCRQCQTLIRGPTNTLDPFRGKGSQRRC